MKECENIASFQCVLLDWICLKNNFYLFTLILFCTLIIARDYYYLNYPTIQKDVQSYGPIEATFFVYDDFPSYKSGMYIIKFTTSIH